ncbi:restriction endonuclease subunit S [Megamonas hypermegale]|uniref:restriction endonuclease subunit S n=1 Tax=Megamonas hypermegale TaxID=158847 RepID=UPI0019591A2E|nr:restriction endonuclease subunit S [Megamonas hypermegale]MBM6762084.1 restriction endonuclease subunit S [Megamonas hypermegale]
MTTKTTWQEIYLSDCIELISGRDVPTKQCNDKKIGIPYILGASNIENNTFSVERWIEKPVVVSLKGDILLSVKGTIGKLYLQKEEQINISRQIMALRATKRIDKKFLFYYLENVCERLKVAGNGLIPGITRKDILNLKINLPNINEQKQIVNIIESLFSKLDKAKQLIQKTVDKFEQNKMAILHKAFSGELTAKWREENNLTLAGWKTIYLGKLLFPMKTRKPSGKTFRYIDIDAIDNLKQTVKEPKIILTEKAPSRASRAVENGDILFSMVRPYLKNIALIDENLSDCIASTGFYVCKCKPNLNAKFLYYLLCFDKTIDYLMQFMKGDNSPSIRKDDLLNMEINLPIIEEQQEIVKILDKIFAKYDKTKTLQNQLEKIELLKKSILAKAFRGQLGTNNPSDENAAGLLQEILSHQ